MSRSQRARSRKPPVITTEPDYDHGDPPPKFWVAANQKEWIECEDEGVPHQGLMIYVRTKVTLAEQRKIEEEHDRLAGPVQEAWRKTPMSERDFSQSPRALQKKLVAPYVYNWNALGIDFETGDEVRLPPPAVAGSAIFDSIDDAAYDWIATIVVGGYMNTGKAGGTYSPSKPTPDGKDGESQESETDPSTQPSQEPSSEPSE